MTVVGRSILQLKGKIMKFASDRRTGGPTQGHPERVVSHNGKVQMAHVHGGHIQSAAIGVGDPHGCQQNIFQQAIHVALDRQGNADFSELLYPAKECFHCFHLLSPCRK